MLIQSVQRMPQFVVGLCEAVTYGHMTPFKEINCNWKTSISARNLNETHPSHHL